MWQIKKSVAKNVVILFAVFFSFQATVGSAVAATIYVDDDGSGNYTTIQAAINNAASGDQIIVKPGTYKEYIEVTVSDLTVVSESGNPDNTIVQAADSSYVFNVLANEVSIKGFSIKGKGDSAGIYINYGLGNCHIENNKFSSFASGIDIFLFSMGNIVRNNEVSNCNEGISLSEGSFNTLSNNTISNCGSGIYLGTGSHSNTLNNNAISSCNLGIGLLGSMSNTLENNIVTENEYGISLADESDHNTLTKNTLKSNKKAGLQITGTYIGDSTSENRIYNNYFSNTANVDSNKQPGIWNTTRTTAKNIINGPYSGGNYWATPAGDGFSQTHSDANGDGIAEEPYSLDGVNVDYLPLIVVSEKPVPVLPVANFKINITQGSAPLAVLFTDSSQNATKRNWDFENDGKVDSIDVNPVHVYTVPGTYTAELTVANENGTASKLATITVTQNTVDNGSTGDNGNTGDNVNGGDGGGDGESSSGDGEEDSGSSGGSSHSSSGGSSGGGGAGGSPEPSKNVEVKEISQKFVTSGKKVEFDFTKNATCVVYVSFDAKKTFGKTTAIAEMLEGKSLLVPELPSGEVYKSFNVWVGNSGFATSKNIENPVICFKVEKAWMQNKSINLDSIALNRYSEKKWEQLSVSLLKEDSKFLYFTANVPGFTSFVITGKAKSTSENVTKVEPKSGIPSIKKDSTKDIESKIAQNLKKGESTKAPGFEIVYGMACLLAHYLYKRK